METQVTAQKTQHYIDLSKPIIEETKQMTARSINYSDLGMATKIKRLSKRPKAINQVNLTSKLPQNRSTMFKQTKVKSALGVTLMKKPQEKPLS